MGGMFGFPFGGPLHHHNGGGLSGLADLFNNMPKNFGPDFSGSHENLKKLREEKEKKHNHNKDEKKDEHHDHHENKHEHEHDHHHQNKEIPKPIKIE